MKEPYNILIVDDDEHIGKLFRDVLEGEGLSVDYAHSGNQALGWVKEKRFDLIFMDVVMPGLNGVETLEKIREWDKDVEVVMISGYSVREMLEKARRIGAHSFLAKPVNLPQIMDVVDEVKKLKEKSSENRLQCLVIDEKSLADTLLFSVLDSAGFSVEIAGECRNALERDNLRTYDLIILNVEPQAWEEAGAFKEAAKGISKEKIVVLVDTTMEEELIEKAFDLGGVKYISHSEVKTDLFRILKESYLKGE